MTDNCRICLESTPPLSSFCDCKGSLKYVHYACLEKWRMSNRRYQCEICKRFYHFPRHPVVMILWSIFIIGYSALLTAFAFLLGILKGNTDDLLIRFLIGIVLLNMSYKHITIEILGLGVMSSVLMVVGLHFVLQQVCVIVCILMGIRLLVKRTETRIHRMMPKCIRVWDAVYHDDHEL